MYKQIAANKRNSIFIMIGFAAFITALGCIFAYYYESWSLAVNIFLFSVIYVVIQFFIADRVALTMTGAQEIQKRDHPRLYNIVENLSITTGLPMPRVYIINDPAPNAFATGRDPKRASVVATTGLIDIMDDKELNAVMAHEISHIKNYDIRLSMIVFGLVCIIGFISDLGMRMLWYGDRQRDEERSPVGFFIMLMTAILAPIVASIAQMAISREREYLADASSVNITRYPEGMIAALKKLDTHARPMRQQNTATESMFIISPLRKGFISNLFSTHPPIEKRIERLEHGKFNF